MKETSETIEGRLVADLASLAERFADDEFSTELYRALTNRVWRKADGPDGHVSLSWNRAESVVNDLRERFGQQALELAQTGGEGELSDVVSDELGRLGWTSQPLNTSRHDDAHVVQPESPPPPDQGERLAPAEPSDWDEVGHAEAEQHRKGTTPPVPPPAA